MRITRYSRRVVVLFFVSVAVLGGLAAPASASPAATPATAYKCGSQCNGHAPTWAIPSNGVQCSNSAKLIGSGHPEFGMTTPPADTSVTVRAYYSTVCQTLWATVTVAASTTDTLCGYIVERTVSPTYEHDATCLRKSVTTPMIDDANGGAVAGYVQVTTQWYAADGSFHGGLWKKSY